MQNPKADNRLNLRELSLKERLVFYKKTMALRDKGYSSWTIADKLNISRSTVGNWVYKNVRPKPIWNLRSVDLSPSPELAYIIGVILGDGTVFEDTIALRVTSKEFVKEFNKNLCSLLEKDKLYCVTKYELDSIFYEVRACSKELGSFLKDKNIQKFKPIIEKYPQHFIQGFADSEGCISFYWSSSRLHKRISLANTCIELLNYIKNLLWNFYKIPSYIGKGYLSPPKRAKDGHLIINQKRCFYLRIGKKHAIKRFAKTIHFSIPEKQEKLNNLIRELEKISGIDPKTGKRKLSKQTKLKMSRARKLYWSKQHA